MTTTTLHVFRVLSDLEEPPQAGSDMIVRGVKVFRVGKFKDSIGRQNEWTPEQLQRAVDNFNLLRRSNVLPHVPVRLDHTKSIRDVVGWFHELRFEAPFLVADLQFTKKSAFDDYQAKHFRNVSLEIGQYETNDEVLYHDVVQGLAFVDQSAVEGLHQHPSGDVITMATETTTGTETKPKESETTPPATPPTEQPPTEQPPTTPPATPPAEPATTPPAPAAPVSEHGRPVAVQTFRIAGVEVSDHAAVQTAIDTMERTISTFRTGLRDSFVDDLASSNRITNPQVAEFKKHVATLSDEQFEAFRTLYDGAQPNSLFGKHDTTTAPVVATAVAEQNEVAIAKETVAQFRRMGKSDEFIKAQPAWATIQAAEAATSK